MLHPTATKWIRSAIRVICTTGLCFQLVTVKHTPRLYRVLSTSQISWLLPKEGMNRWFSHQLTKFESPIVKKLTFAFVPAGVAIASKIWVTLEISLLNYTQVASWISSQDLIIILKHPEWAEHLEISEWQEWHEARTAARSKQNHQFV